jgi:hypothetical protein
MQVGDTPCHPKSPAAIGFLTKASPVNRTLLMRQNWSTRSRT